MRVVPVDEEQGHVALGLALRHLSNTGILMHTTAHPDDENNGLLVMLNRGQGYRTALATATRGNGGQNEIGPEIFLHRFDGAEQYFTRAVDFGFSFSLDETFEKWGRDEITADYVRLIRMIHPDVVIGLPPAGEGGGQHHQASSIITRDAVKIAGDKTKYPDQIEAGLRPWQPKKFYYLAAFGFPGEPPVQGRSLRINLSGYDALLGKTYQEIGTEARSMHKCQGMAQLLSLPGPAATIYKLAETTIPGEMDRDETSLFDGIDTTIAGLAKLAGAKPPKELVDGLAQIASQVQAAQKRFDTENDQAVLAPLIAGLHATRVTRAQLRSLQVDDQARAEIGFRLIQKEREFQQAALLANGVRLEALADDGIVVPGQTANVNVIVANRGAAEVAVRQIKFEGFDPSTSSGQAGAACALTPFTATFSFPGAPRPAAAPAGPVMTSVKKDQVAHCEPTLTIPAKARITEPYWHRAGEAGRYTFDNDAPFGRPFRPTDFYVQATLAFAIPGGTEEVIDGLPIEYRYEGNIFSGEKRTELLVVPPFSVRVSPEVAIVPAASIRTAPQAPASAPAAGRGRGAPPAAGGRAGGAAPAAGGRPSTGSGQAGRGAAQAPASTDGPPSADREIRVTVVNDTPAAADTVVKLEVPPGWTATPAEQPAKFSRADESRTVRFQVRPAPTAMVGEYHVKATVSSGEQTFDRGYQAIEYPHIRRAHIYDDADTKIKVIDVRTPANMTIGYVMGTGDQVPPAIAQLGMKIEMITADDLAWGNLARFDAIVTGVRAYEHREDLRANNSRLLEYVFNGGTAIVQYNKFEFNDAQFGPFPAKVSSSRVTDEAAPVQVLEKRDPVFTTPNEVGEAAWKNWVQERGLYFLGEKDSRYRDLIAIEDPFPYNKGEKTGALVEAIYGKGRWVYVGLNLWRQLPVGTDGAYQLLANLLSLGKTVAR